MNTPNTSIWTKILFALSLFTSLSPIDAIPDFMPILGQIDDAIAIPLAIGLGIKILYDRRKRKQQGNRSNDRNHYGFENAKYAGEDYGGESVFKEDPRR